MDLSWQGAHQPYKTTPCKQLEPHLVHNWSLNPAPGARQWQVSESWVTCISIAWQACPLSCLVIKITRALKPKRMEKTKKGGHWLWCSQGERPLSVPSCLWFSVWLRLCRLVCPYVIYLPCEERASPIAAGPCRKGRSWTTLPEANLIFSIWSNFIFSIWSGLSNSSAVL